MEPSPKDISDFDETESAQAVEAWLQAKVEAKKPGNWFSFGHLVVDYTSARKKKLIFEKLELGKNFWVYIKNSIVSIFNRATPLLERVIVKQPSQNSSIVSLFKQIVVREHPSKEEAIKAMKHELLHGHARVALEVLKDSLPKNPKDHLEFLQNIMSSWDTNMKLQYGSEAPNTIYQELTEEFERTLNPKKGGYIGFFDHLQYLLQDKNSTPEDIECYTKIACVYLRNIGNLCIEEPVGRASTRQDKVFIMLASLWKSYPIDQRPVSNALKEITFERLSWECNNGQAKNCDDIASAMGSRFPDALMTDPRNPTDAEKKLIGEIEERRNPYFDRRFDPQWKNDYEKWFKTHPQRVF